MLEGISHYRDFILITDHYKINKNEDGNKLLSIVVNWTLKVCLGVSGFVAYLKNL